MNGVKGQNGGEEEHDLSWVVQESIMEERAEMGTVRRNPMAQKLLFHLVGGGPFSLPVLRTGLGLDWLTNIRRPGGR